MKSFSNGLARAAVRFKPSAFAGTFVALALAAVIVSACGILMETGLRASVPAHRYAHTPVVVAADQRVHFFTGHGEDREDDPVQVPDHARVAASLVGDAARTKGAAAAAPDVIFPVHGPRGTLTAHGWGSAAFTGTRLATGAAPRADEAVLDTADARAAGVGVGDRITLTAADGPHRVRVSGLADGTKGGESGPAVWFADAAARALSGHPEVVDAVLVRPEPGTGPQRLAERLKQTYAHAHGVRVHTGGGRGGAEQPGLGEGKEALIALGGSFGGIATAVAVFTVAGTVALCVGQRRREFALLRAIGATPRQLRRAVAAEALLVAPLAGAVGVLPGIGLAHWWFGQLRDRGAVPHDVDFAVSWLPLLIAVGAGLVTSLFAGLMAARRPARIKPGLALGEAAVERLRPGVIRTVLGVAALGGGVVVAVIAGNESGDDAANTALGVVMLFMLAVALLGPLVARLCAGLLGLPLRAGSASAVLASANSRVNARRLASAITPIVLAMAFASTLVFMHTSEDHVAAGNQRDGIVADHILSADGGLPAGAAARAAAAPGVDRAVGVLNSGVLVAARSAGGWLQSAQAQGVTGTGRDLAAVEDLDVRTGSLGALRDGTVAIDGMLAESARVKLGDRLDLWLPDGTRTRPKVVATYGRGLGIAQITVVRRTLAPHVTGGYDTQVLVRDTHGADPDAVTSRLAPLGSVTDRAGYAAEQDKDRKLNAWGNTTMAAVLGGFAAVAAANTLVMTVLDRRRELSTLRLIGTTERQIRGMVRWEALLVVTAGLVLGTAIALATLVPMMRGLTGQDPYIPPLTYAGFAGAVTLLGLAATALPARAALRRGI